MSASSLQSVLEPARNGGGLSSVHKALALLGVVAAQTDTVRLSDLAAAVDLPKSTTHRLLKELEAAGFVGRVGSRYQPGNGFFELGELARRAAYGVLRDSALAPMATLFERAGATVHLGVLAGSEVLYLEKLTGAAGSRLPTRVGSRWPATCTALGKAMLAFAPQSVLCEALANPLVRMTPYSISEPRRLLDELRLIRSNRVATEREEGRLGVSCVASPVLIDGVAVAAVSLCLAGVAGPTGDQIRLVRTAAEEIAARLTPDVTEPARLRRRCG